MSSKQNINDLLIKLTQFSVNSFNQTIDDDFGDVISNANTQLESIETSISQLKRLRNEFDKNMREIKPTLTKIEPLLSKYEQLSQLHSLCDKLDLIGRTHHCLQANTNGIRDKELDAKLVVLTRCFKQLVAEFDLLERNHYKPIVLSNYILDVITYWRNILKQLFLNKFTHLLTAIEWPIISTASITTKCATTGDNINNFNMYFKALLDIDVSHIKMSETELEFHSICEPMRAMLTPLEKRFQYHFIDAKSKLNKPSKPEWYLSQVITWIRENEAFLIDNIDPILRSHFVNEYFVSARLQLIKGLLRLVSKKLGTDLKSHVCDDYIFTHIVDELFIFNRELISIEPDIYDTFPDSNVTKLFSCEPYFSRILSIERKKSTDSVEFIMESQNAWNVLCGDECDEELRITECADNFFAILQAIRDRSSLLSEMSDKYEFVKLQLEILDDFRIRLTQLLHDCADVWPYSNRYFAIINTINYLIIVLQEWNTLAYYIELADIYSPKEPIFRPMIVLFEHMLNEFIRRLINDFMNQTRNKIYDYQKIKWFCMKSSNDLNLTSNACELFHFIATNLTLLKNSMSNALFNQIILDFADEINKILLEDVVLKNTFNEFGAKQLDYDITNGLMSLFRQYMSEPEDNFAELIESCKLINIQRGSALLLTDLLQNKGTMKESQKALKEMSVTTLSPQLALTVIRKRLFV